MFGLMPLPYPTNALEPAMSRDTLETHHGKHHKTYVEKLNKLVSRTQFADATLEDIIQKTYDDSKSHSIFNNAAQVWNHEFFWHSMRPGGGGAPDGNIAREIASAFSSYDSFSEKFVEAATEHFASGYAWLVKTPSGLRILTTDNAATPILWGFHPLFCCDLWEHAYYLDYRSERKRFLDQFLDNLVNWRFVQDRLGLEIEPHRLAAARLEREQDAFSNRQRVWHAPHAVSETVLSAKATASRETRPRGHA
jgi:superoxide dismutase, Fe-Mn family